MKTFKFLLTALLVTTLFTFNQCKKDKTTDPTPDNTYGLPNATQTGVNIFACRVNGVNWISELGIYKMGGGVSNDTLSCRGTVNGDIIEVLILGGANQNSSYNLNTNNKLVKYRTQKTCLGFLGNVITINSISGLSTISKIDINNKIISGFFSCKIPIPSCDTLNITDGRFDIKYN